MKVVEVVKKDSSKFIKTLHEDLNGFQWQDGYGLFGVSATHVPAVRDYILNQAEHHRKVSFQEEFLRILKKHNIPYNEEYLWG